MLFNIFLAFGAGIGINHPLDIHIPGPEELKEEYLHELDKAGLPESIQLESIDEDGNSIVIDLS